LCPLPHVQLAEGELEAAWEALDRGAVALRPGGREPQDGESALLAAGYARQAVRAFAAQGARQTWRERRFVVRSLRHAKAAEVSLRARGAKAPTHGAALHQHGRGRKRFEKLGELRQAATAMVQRPHVEDFWGLRDDHQCPSRPVRAYRHREAGSTVARQATGEVRGDEEALARAVGRLGWRVSVTQQPRAPWSWEQAVLAYRRASLVERSCGRLTGRPLSLTPMDVQRDEHATGLMRLWSIALRVLTRTECIGRRHRAWEQGKIAGLSAGNPQRETARPTAERFLEVFHALTRTVIELPQQTMRPMTPLHPIQRRILEILGFSAEVYTSLEAISVEPP
jgi:transposase